MGPDFTVETEGIMTSDEALLKRVGAQREADWIYYYWQPKTRFESLGSRTTDRTVPRTRIDGSGT